MSEWYIDNTVDKQAAKKKTTEDTRSPCYMPIATGFGSARMLSTSTTKSKHEESSHGPRTLLVGLQVGDEVGVELPLLPAAGERERSGRSGKMRCSGFACHVRGAGAGPRGRNASGWKTGRGTDGRICLGWDRGGRGPWKRWREEGGPRRPILSVIFEKKVMLILLVRQMKIREERREHTRRFYMARRRRWNQSNPQWK